MTDQERTLLTKLRDAVDELLYVTTPTAKQLGFDYLRLLPIVIWLLQKVFELLREHLDQADVNQAEPEPDTE